jgi:phosphoglycolate phosphatase
VKLLLFDIDGTLITGDQAGRLAMGAAMERVFGTKGSLDTYVMGGKTDKGIVSDLLLEAGMSRQMIEANLEEFYIVMAEFAREIYPTRTIAACPGIESLLLELQGRENVLMGLLTGNAHTTASLKLAAAGINPDQFVVTVFGSEDEDRNNLLGIALQRANELTGGAVTIDNVVIIGDTPADVQCARVGGVKAVAVASGWHAADILLQNQPDYLFPDLSDTEAVLQVLLGYNGE